MAAEIETKATKIKQETKKTPPPPPEKKPDRGKGDASKSTAPAGDSTTDAPPPAPKKENK